MLNKRLVVLKSPDVRRFCRTDYLNIRKPKKWRLVYREQMAEAICKGDILFYAIHQQFDVLIFQAKKFISGINTEKEYKE